MSLMKVALRPRLGLVAAFAVLAVSAHALTLNPTWAGGRSLTASSPNGDSVTLFDPVVVDSSSTAADALAQIVQNQPLWFGGQPVTINRAASWNGTVDLDRIRATTSLDSGSGRYFTGWDFGFRLQSGDPLGTNTRFVVIEDGNWVFNEGFEQANELYYYSPSNESGRRGGSNQYGSFDYEFDSNLGFLTAPGTYNKRIDIFLVTETITQSGVTLDVHDAVQFEGTYVQSPVPEPATMAALGLGVAAMIRRRKKS